MLGGRERYTRTRPWWRVHIGAELWLHSLLVPTVGRWFWRRVCGSLRQPQCPALSLHPCAALSFCQPQKLSHRARDAPSCQQLCHCEEQMGVLGVVQQWAEVVGVIPDAPPAAPLRADLTFLLNVCSSKLNTGTRGGNSGIGSIGLAGLLFNSLSVVSFPGANSAPSNACRPDDNSPI